MTRKLLMIVMCTAFAITSISAQSTNYSGQEYQRADSMIVSQLKQKNVTFSHNNSVVLLTNGHDKFDDMLPALCNAKSSIHMEYFNFRNDSIANTVFDILRRKAAEGVEVRVLFDAFGNMSNSKPLNKEFIENLRADNILVNIFDPVKFPWINHVLSRDHRKIVVIDGQVAYTGGMNVADYYINGTTEVKEWHDMHCRIEGDEVNTLQRIFMRSWQKMSGEVLDGSKYFFDATIDHSYLTTKRKDETETAGKKTVGIINREPHTSNEIIRYFYINAINNAKDSIKIVTPYFTPSRKLRKALKNAVKRGVKVELMLSMKNDVKLTPDCGFYNAHKLMKKGVDVWIFLPGFHHTKAMMVDGQFCTVGSANLDSRSMRFDYEVNAVIIDSCTTQQMTDIYDHDITKSFKLTEQSWNAWRTRKDKIRGWWAHLLSPLL